MTAGPAGKVPKKWASAAVRLMSVGVGAGVLLKNYSQSEDLSRAVLAAGGRRESRRVDAWVYVFWLVRLPVVHEDGCAGGVVECECPRVPPIRLCDQCTEGRCSIDTGNCQRGKPRGRRSPWECDCTHELRRWEWLLDGVE